MARIRVIGKKEAPVVKRQTIGQKLYSGFKAMGQKVVDNRYAIGSLFAAAAAAAAIPNRTLKEKAYKETGVDYGFPNVPSHSQLSPPTKF